VQDDQAFIRARTGYTFQTPDEGGEIGIQPGPFFLACSITNGAAGDKDVAATANGYTMLEDVPIVRHVLAGDHRPLLDGGIALDDEDVLAILSGLHRLRRYDGRVRERLEPQRDTRELAWPKPEVGVVECRLEPRVFAEHHVSTYVYQMRPDKFCAPPDPRTHTATGKCGAHAKRIAIIKYPIGSRHHGINEPHCALGSVRALLAFSERIGRDTATLSRKVLFVAFTPS